VFLDTSFCVDLLRERVRGEAGPAMASLQTLADEAMFLSVFVLCELQAGARMSARPNDELGRVSRLLEHVELVLPDATFASLYGELEASLRKSGTPIPTMDLLIGTAAKQYGMPLLTRDPRHFARIDGLIVESYSAAR
jgi:predicted nucleic acid-binding protein